MNWKNELMSEDMRRDRKRFTSYEIYERSIADYEINDIPRALGFGNVGIKIVHILIDWEPQV